MLSESVNAIICIIGSSWTLLKNIVWASGESTWYVSKKNMHFEAEYGLKSGIKYLRLDPRVFLTSMRSICPNMQNSLWRVVALIRLQGMTTPADAIQCGMKDVECLELSWFRHEPQIAKNTFAGGAHWNQFFHRVTVLQNTPKSRDPHPRDNPFLLPHSFI